MQNLGAPLTHQFESSTADFRFVIIILGLPKQLKLKHHARGFHAYRSKRSNEFPLIFTNLKELWDTVSTARASRPLA